MAQTVFRRIEMKYRITQAQKSEILRGMMPHMDMDHFGRTTIRNLYLDTDDYLLIRRSIEKPTYKEKIRIRSYGEDRVFVELKKKCKGIVFKRRVALPQREALAWVNGQAPCPFCNQITKEIDFFLGHYPSLHPTLFLSYEREAYKPKERSDFRVTFDDTVLCRQEDLTFDAGVYGTAILPEDEVLMEIKGVGGMPLWMARILSEQKIYKTSFSKYGTAYRTLIFPKIKEERFHV